MGIKISLPEIEGILRKLVELGATKTGQTKETDIYFDDTNKNLSRFDKALRIREGGKKPVLFFKDRLNRTGIEVTDIEKTTKILHGLGFHESGKVEKIRQKFVYQRATIHLDKLPFMGYFLEIDGLQESVELALERLRIDVSKNLTKNYLELFEDYMRENRIRVENNSQLTFLNETRYQKI